jgi:transposase
VVSQIAQRLIGMKMFVEPADIYLHVDAVDFRKSINGLVVVVEQQLELSPFSDALFIFCNKHKNKLKILYWDKTGFALWYKRLEKQRFKWPKDRELSRLMLSEQQLNWLLDGYDIIGHQPLVYQTVSL